MNAPQPNLAGLSLRITAINAVPLSGRTVSENWTSHHALIAVHTDGGIIGHGSAYTDGGLAQAAVKVLEPLFIGENALEPQRVSEKLHQNTFWMGRGGSITHAISGIDIALWDILGKATGMPVGRLLGRHVPQARPAVLLAVDGRAGEDARPRRPLPRRWLSRLQRLAGGRSAAAVIRRWTKRSSAPPARAAGDASRLFVDAGASEAFWPNGLAWARRTAQMLGDYNVGWFEEPLRPDAIDDYCDLRRSSPVPISGGEVLTRRQSFVPWLTRGALDIVQPDATKVGGISEQRRIGWLAEEFGIKLVGHGWNTALGVAADLQMAAALPNTDLVEFIGGSTYVDDIIETPFALDADGWLAIPERPGFGVALDRERLARYTPDPSPLFAQ